MNNLSKYEAYRVASKFDSFLANVIFCHYSNPTKKLNGVVRLFQSGHSVSIGNTIDHLLIDGYTAQWSDLEVQS